MRILLQINITKKNDARKKAKLTRLDFLIHILQV